MDPDPTPSASSEAEERSDSAQNSAHRNITVWFNFKPQNPRQATYHASTPHESGHVTDGPGFQVHDLEDTQIADPSHQARTNPPFTKANSSGPETLAQLRKRHDELVEEIKHVKRRINLRELIEKEKAMMHEKELERKREQEAKQEREQEEMEKFKEPETGIADDEEMDVDIILDD